MFSGIVGGMVLTWVAVAAELSTTAVLYREQWQTLTVVLLQTLEGTSGPAAATASLLIFFTVVPVALVYRLLRWHEMSLL